MAAPPSSLPPPTTNVDFPFNDDNYVIDPAPPTFNDTSLPNNPPVLPSPPRNTIQPSYAEMIYTAIGALKEKNGSSRRAISKYMKHVYKDNLASNHDVLLTKNLRSLNKNGHLVLLKKSYLLPTASIQRHSEPDQAQQVAQSQHNAQSEPAQNANTIGDGGVTEVKKRGRGRPSRATGLKAQAKPADAGAIAPVPADPVVHPKPRGRPRKNAVTASSASDGGADKKLAGAEKKSRKKPSKKPVRPPKETIDPVEKEKRAEINKLKKRIELFQSKIGESVSVLDNYFGNDRPNAAYVALRNLESLADLDIDLPLSQNNYQERPFSEHLQFRTRMQSVFNDPPHA